MIPATVTQSEPLKFKGSKWSIMKQPALFMKKILAVNAMTDFLILVKKIAKAI